MNRALRKSPFACRMSSKAGCGRRQGSAMNSLRSALTAVLAGLSDSKMQAKGDTEPRYCGFGYTLYRTGTKYRSGQGRVAIEPQFYMAGEFRDGVAPVAVDPLDWEGHVVKKRYIDKQGRFIWGPNYAVRQRVELQPNR